ncbi:DUF1553 domain-containing protein [Stieleria varia]|uniref:Planctomycete cytochrome C n=1 Tax=Stieleria varia TaxID=2528005 RepID=A0A5C6B2Q5_9BACT|nr:DUF1553 domain-containing protein [Stieleria varia]TWU06180.1 Planctomycete cytochrome C [Stieleria varia]
MIRKLFPAAAMILGILNCASVRSHAEDLFRDQIAPILERRCVSCHNDGQREGDFSLQTATSALADGFIEPGDAENSHLLDLITPTNGKAGMPKDADPLSDAERNLIRDWINDGANWPEGLRLTEAQVSDFDWWSFHPVQRPNVPPTQGFSVDDTWVRTPIDAFILKRLHEKGLTHASEADRRTLIRRLSFDLTGLPPTPAETAAFINDPDPHAYEKLVDRLLDSQHYGERWARHWLDVVKYADTCGYDKDKLRPNAWPYRDYVIRSFNEDKPYARFVQEQIAGDALFPGDPDGILGLGFIAAGPWDFIGHVEVSESKIDGKVARNLDRDDMVSNAMNTFCSVTIQCARCHHHKFDPFTQQHYYGLQAIFAAMDRAERPYDLDPTVESQRRQLESQITNLKSELAAFEKEIREAAGPRLAELQTQLTALQKDEEIKKDAAYGYHSGIAKTPDSLKWVDVTLPQPTDVSLIVLHPCHDEFAGIGSGFGFPLRFKVQVSSSQTVADNTQWTTIADHTQQDHPNPGLTPVEIECHEKNIQRVRITATQLAPRKDDYILALAELAVFDSEKQQLDLANDDCVSALDSIEAPVRWQKSNLVDGKWPQGGNPEIDQQIADLNKELQSRLAEIETPQRVERRKELTTSIEAAEAQLKELPKGKMVYAAATHFAPQSNFKPTEGEPRPIHVLMRGDVQNPSDEVVPGILPLSSHADWQLDDELPESQRRAELARWLTRSDHPLVWRSIVNRVWQYHFGQGIVATPNDFGRMGAAPTHPELLDWLACEFRDGGQSFKTLHRLIVTSSVYRQSSENHSDNAAIDGGNQYLWRMNRRRLEAEEIRDSILAVSGALDTTAGGPGFYLFELEHPQHSPHYEYHKFDPTDPKSHRRSIYRFIVRSQPNPWMTTLDCADSSQSTPRRSETLTSLQALSMLNNRFNLVMAERFAQRLQQQAATLDEQVELAMQLATQRRPEPMEHREFTAYAKNHGLANLCRFLFNLSEFVYLD